MRTKVFLPGFSEDGFFFILALDLFIYLFIHVVIYLFICNSDNSFIIVRPSPVVTDPSKALVEVVFFIYEQYTVTDLTKMHAQQSKLTPSQIHVVLHR